MEDRRASTSERRGRAAATARSASAGARGRPTPAMEPRGRRKRARAVETSGSRCSMLEASATRSCRVALSRTSAASQRAFPRTTPSAATCSCARCRAKRCSSATGRRSAMVATVFDLLAARTTASTAAWAARTSPPAYDDDVPYTPGLAGADHRREARASVITVARQFAENADKTQGKSMVIIGAGDEPLVPQRHELPRHHQHADDVRLRRQERRRLGALRRPGEAAPADRLDRARLRARLDPPAAADELALSSSTRTPTSGATRSSAWTRSSRRWPTRSATAAA